jgi:P-type E1-E2 ATPase
LAQSRSSIWYSIGGLETGLMVALSVLLIACPCALGLATPLTFWLSLERAAESGVILRSTAALERLAKVERIFFDKTGTLDSIADEGQEVFVAPFSESDLKKEERHPGKKERNLFWKWSLRLHRK